MTTNANDDGVLALDSASDTSIYTIGTETIEGLNRSSNFLWSGVIFGVGLLFFIVCWIFAGVIIFHHLMSAGVFLIFAVLGAIIGGFIAAASTWVIGMSGVI